MKIRWLLFISKPLHISIKESAEQPNMPRQLTDRLTNLTREIGSAMFEEADGTSFFL